MKQQALLLIAAAVLAFAGHAPAAGIPAPVQARGMMVAAFAPEDDVEGLIVGELDRAQREVLVQAYLLTSKPIAAALTGAHRRGVDVRVLVDGRQADRVESSKVRQLVKAGIPVWREDGYENAHDKVMVIDAALPRAVVITGSYNFTWTAQHRNAENVLVARGNPELAARFHANWERRMQAATPMTR
ncbi:MAG: phospholipase D family protein [Burkholderiaceae bacterium]